MQKQSCLKSTLVSLKLKDVSLTYISRLIQTEVDGICQDLTKSHQRASNELLCKSLTSAVQFTWLSPPFRS